MLHMTSFYDHIDMLQTTLFFLLKHVITVLSSFYIDWYDKLHVDFLFSLNNFLYQ